MGQKILKIGDRITLTATVVNVYFQGHEDPSHHAVGLQLADGQGVMTNVRNLDVQEEDAAPVPAEDLGTLSFKELKALAMERGIAFKAVISAEKLRELLSGAETISSADNDGGGDKGDKGDKSAVGLQLADGQDKGAE